MNGHGVTQHIGFIGPGNMGAPMVARLLAGGTQVTVWARDPAKCTALIGSGAHLAEDMRDAVGACDLVISCLASPEVLESAYLASDGLVSVARPGQIFVDHTTTSPRTAADIADALSKKSAQFLDAPVSGGPQRAAEGSLVSFVGGPPEALDAVRHVLTHYTAAVHRCGDNGSGQSLKLVNQLLVIIHAVAAAEAASLVDSSGIDPLLARRALAGGWAASAMVDYVLPRALAGEFTPEGATVRGLAEVASLVSAFLEDAKTDSSLFAAALVSFRSALSAGLGGAGLGALIETVVHLPEGVAGKDEPAEAMVTVEPEVRITESQAQQRR